MSKNENTKPDIGQVVLQELVEGNSKKKKTKRSFWNVVSIPLLAIISGLIIGAILIAVTSEEVYAAFGASFWSGIGEMGRQIGTAYSALFVGSIGDPVKIITALQSGDAQTIRYAFNPFLESLVQSTPYIFASLACALAFRAGLF